MSSDMIYKKAAAIPTAMRAPPAFWALAAPVKAAVARVEVLLVVVGLAPRVTVPADETPAAVVMVLTTGTVTTPEETTLEEVPTAMVVGVETVTTDEETVLVRVVDDAA